MEVKLKLLVFSFVLLMIKKIQKLEIVNIQSDCETTCKKRTVESVCLHAVEKHKKEESINTRNDCETMSEK